MNERFEWLATETALLGWDTESAQPIPRERWQAASDFVDRCIIGMPAWVSEGFPTPGEDDGTVNLRWSSTRGDSRFVDAHKMANGEWFFTEHTGDGHVTGSCETDDEMLLRLRGFFE